ncbi:transglycosylase SLT domain-containing protein, partial [Pseudomonas sp. NPDC089569]|uniref:transglycosylase SLT domain-containing protein n=1 Tax=Pseudomonas sp. NPDC089569 TaxID=3390722 RepID=UPI003D049E6B
MPVSAPVACWCSSLPSATTSPRRFYNASALSPKGAGGLMQLMPDTAREMGVANVY